MPISEETRAALDLLKDVRAKVAAADDLKADRAVNDDLNTLISVLESPVFQSILNIKDSLRELKRQVQLHPSILPADFDITPTGELVLNLPNSDSGAAPGVTVDDREILRQHRASEGVSADEEGVINAQNGAPKHLVEVCCALLICA